MWKKNSEKKGETTTSDKNKKTENYRRQRVKEMVTRKRKSGSVEENREKMGERDNYKILLNI